MDILSALCAAHRRMIAENPVQVTISRTERVEQNGAFAEVKSQHGPYTVRLFQNLSQRSAREVTVTPGTKQTDTRWGLAADESADLRAGPDVTDEFEVAGVGSFRVTAVYPLMLAGATYGYQAELERVS